MYECPCGPHPQQRSREDEDESVTVGTAARAGPSPMDRCRDHHPVSSSSQQAHHDAVDASGRNKKSDRANDDAAGGNTNDNTMPEASSSTATDLAAAARTTEQDAMDVDMIVAHAAADLESLDGGEHPRNEQKKNLESGGGGMGPEYSLDPPGNNIVHYVVPADKSRAPPPTLAKAGEVSATPTCQRVAAAVRSIINPSPATTARPYYDELQRLVQKLRKENADLNQCLDNYESYNRRLEQELYLSQQQFTRAAKERNDAVHDRQRLLHELQGSVVDRTVRTTAGAFPAGDALITACHEYGEETEFFLNDLARAIEDQFPTSTLNDPLRLAMDAVLTMLRDYFAVSKDVADQVVAGKRVQFEAFLGQGANETVNSMLANLLWQSTMQNHVKMLIDNSWYGLISICEDGATRQQEQHEHGVVAAAEGVGMFDEGALGTNRLKFCKSILYLDLVCRFSQPQCFLFPDIGATVPFDGKHHKQVYLCLAGETKVKAGESVRVLFPGLYFVSPTGEDGRRGEKPVVRALVAQIITTTSEC